MTASTPPAPPADADPLLGLDASGAPLTVAACRAAGKNPLDYLQADGVTLTQTGRQVLEQLNALVAADPELRARELGIDIEAIRRWCTAERKPFAEALQAEVDLQQMITRDRETFGFQEKEKTA